MNHLKHRNKTEVVAFTSTGLEGSRFPKFRAAVGVVNEQDPVDTTVAVTDTELGEAAKPMLAITKIERIKITIGTVFNRKLHLFPFVRSTIDGQAESPRGAANFARPSLQDQTRYQGAIVSTTVSA